MQGFLFFWWGGGAWSFRLFSTSKKWGTPPVTGTFPPAIAENRVPASFRAFLMKRPAIQYCSVLGWILKKNRCNFSKSSNKNSGKALKETVINAWPCLAMKLVTIFYSHHPDDESCVSHALRMPSFNDVKKESTSQIDAIFYQMPRRQFYQT